MAKQWLMDRWEMLFDVLKDLTLEQEEEIARICQEEIAYWRSRPSMKSLSSLKRPMSDTRNAIKEKLLVTDETAWTNPRGERVHIALKYLNYTPEEYAEINAQTEEHFQERLENRKLIDHPDLVVAKAADLLRSDRWDAIVVGLAVVTGRRVSEVLKEGEFFPRTRYTVVFAGQLKKDQDLAPYEIPTLVDAELVLSAWRRLRQLIDCSALSVEAVSKQYSSPVTDLAQQQFADLIPPVGDDSDLYTRLCRSVYGRIATHYYAPVAVSDIKYMNTIYGHYWIEKAKDEKTKHYYLTTMHYIDYLIGDGHGNIDGRQGIKLSEPGVEILEVFRKAEKEGKPMEEAKTLVVEEKKEHGLLRPDPKLMARIKGVRDDLGVKKYNDALVVMVDAFYEARQFKQFQERWGASLKELDEQMGQLRLLLSHWGTTVEELNGLLDEAAQDAAKEKDGRKRKTPVGYLREMVAAKRTFKQSYEKRHESKDYSTMSLTELRNTKTPDAAAERFKRAVDAIIAYNNSVDDPNNRWFINAAVVVDLVGGKASSDKQYSVSDYLETRRQELEAHHKSFNPELRPGYNRRPVGIIYRVPVPELPGEEGNLEEQIKRHEEREAKRLGKKVEAQA
jgi:hypothetical protein